MWYRTWNISFTRWDDRPKLHVAEASSLLNALRSHAYGPVLKAEPPYEGAAVPAM